MNANIRLAIIGTGPSALACATEIRSAYPHAIIDVLDIGTSKSELDFTKPNGMKTYFGSTHSYDGKYNILNVVGMDKVVFASKGFGGFSRIWGAAIGSDENPSLNFSSVTSFDLGHQEDALFTKSGIKILSKSTAPPEKSTRAKLHLQKHRLAVDKSKCIGCGRCLDGCPTNAIWFAGDEWKLIPNITFKNNHYVTKIEQIAEKVIVTVEGQPNALVYDSLYVACGTIGTAILLMKSKMIPDTVSFSDSQTIFIPFIKSPIKDSGFSFSLSQISFKIDLPGFNPLHLQIYPDTRNMSGRVEIFSPRFGFLLVRIWNYLSRFLSAGILYLDGANSQKLELRLIDDGKFILSPKTSVEAIGQTKYALKESVKAVRSIGLFGLTYFAKIAAPGEGYHFGAIDALQNVHSDGSLPAASNIHIVDGSVLKSIPAGPITPSIMENARIITRNSLPHEK